MFSFFRRNKSKPTSNNNNNNNESKISLNMQLAIERQQASLHQTLEVKRQSDVNVREQQNVNSHTASAPLAYIDDEDRSKNRSAELVNERDKTNVLPSDTCAEQKHQNYDQYRDAKRTSYFLNESIEYAGRLATTPINCYLPNKTLFVASSTIDQKCSTAPGNDSNNNSAHNSVVEVMGRGRNRNKPRNGSGPAYPQNHNRNIVKNQKKDDENVSKNFKEVASENVTKFEIEQSPEPQTPNTAASAVENSEKSASISCENVLHDEDSCSINSQPENKNDNIATSEDVKTSAVEAASEATNIVSAHDEKIVASVAGGVKNDEHHLAQQVGFPLQRNPSAAKRVTFAPSPPRSVASSLSDDEEETISSEDIFYEAADLPNETQQKLRILSTLTSHSSESETSSSSSAESSFSTSFTNDNKNNNKDIVCGKIILSVNDGGTGQLSDNKTDDIKESAFSSSEDTSFSSQPSTAPKTVKPSYLQVGEDTIALPDIVAETSLYEHQNDEMANLGSQASNYNGSGNSVSSQQIEIVDQMQLKVNELCMKIDELQRDLDIKTGAVDRLQSELEATNKEGECVRQRLRFQDEQLEKVKERQDLSAEEEKDKYVLLERQYIETVSRLQKMQSLASTLNVQLAQASVDVEKLRQERDELLDKLTAQEKLLRDILQTATDEREQIIAKWKHDFEQLRNVNSDREEHLMEDCEWKLRSMMKQCKEKLEKAESEKLSLKDQAQIDKQTIKSQRDEIKNLKVCEREANQLRGLSQEQKDSISSMLQRIDDLKAELSTLKRRLQDEIDSCLQIKRDCSYQLSEKERSCINRVEIARGEAAIEWEDRLFCEMSRLTLELEQVHLDERNSALHKQKEENLLEVQVLTTKFKQQERTLLDEIAALKLQLNVKQEELRETQTKADNQLLENRAYLDRREREHQKESDRHQSELERQLRLHSDLIEEIKGEHKREKEQIKASFYRSLEQIKEEFANEITLTTETLQGKHKREMDEQWKQLVHEKEEALLSAENRFRIRIEDADNKLSFEEMRMRYERRDPRPEDLRQIDELKSVVDSQEKDIFYLTEQLRDFQLQQNHQNQTNQQNTNQSKKNKGNRNNKNMNINKNSANINGNSNDNDQPQMRHHAEPQQTKQSANHDRDQQQRMKPPPLIKTIIYEEENENELYEQQIREERENAKKSQDQDFESELHSQQNGVMVELVPESPDYITKDKSMEEISEAHLISDQEFYIPDVVVLPPTSPDEKNREIRIEVISTIEPANIQIVSNGNASYDELD